MPTDQVQHYDLTNLEWRLKNDLNAEMRDEVGRLRERIDQLQWILVIATCVVLISAGIFLPLFFATLDTVKWLAETAGS